MCLIVDLQQASITYKRLRARRDRCDLPLKILAAIPTNGRRISSDHLVAQVWGPLEQVEDPRQTISRHMSRMRQWLRSLGQDAFAELAERIACDDQHWYLRTNGPVVENLGEDDI